MMSNNGLSKLVEELGELLQVAGKIDAYGMGEHPDGKGLLMDRFIEEAGDALAAIDFVSEKFGVDYDRVLHRRDAKLHLFLIWDARDDNSGVSK